MKLLLTFLIVATSVSAQAQTRILKLTSKNVVSVELGPSPTACVYDGNYTASQDIFVTLKDNSVIKFASVGIDRDMYYEDMNIPATCGSARHLLEVNVKKLNEDLLALQNGDINAEYVNGKYVCSLPQFDVFLKGIVVKEYHAVKVEVACPE